MKQQLQNYIFERHNWYNSCKQFGIQCDDGWFNVINEFNSKVDNYLKKNFIKDFKIERIKENCGRLQITANSVDETIKKYIDEAEDTSLFVCEKCGGQGNPVYVRGWAITVCESCLQTAFK